MGIMIYLPNVVTLALDQEACIGCGMCRKVCPHGVFGDGDGKAEIHNRDACMECGACARNCPVDALAVDAGVGCASGVIAGALCGGDPCCGGEDGSGCCG